jgi:hypothetical protein
LDFFHSESNEASTAEGNPTLDLVRESIECKFKTLKGITHQMDHYISTLSPGRNKLVATMRRNPYCKIDMVIRGREPSFTPAPKITREIWLGTDAATRPVADESDFSLKRVILELFEYFDKLPDGSAITIEVRHGLPTRLIYNSQV